MQNFERARLAAIGLACHEPFGSGTHAQKISVDAYYRIRRRKTPFIDDSDVDASLSERIGAHYAGGTCTDNENIDMTLLQ